MLYFIIGLFNLQPHLSYYNVQHDINYKTKYSQSQTETILAKTVY